MSFTKVLYYLGVSFGFSLEGLQDLEEYYLIGYYEVAIL